ncbi:transglutaminase family protein [Roseomonas sp. NAR14]|uniref:Transglutaminase family protein n=1 Tax=Roseomonas acroporae TaxID=2937791 RepID=A0A9X1YCL9_9PROT|nr:transglutaminase family protein [Roseomonas acroporae]MCK8787312.1 transglutaminase family protein [Roseomonas acroporae]
MARIAIEHVTEYAYHNPVGLTTHRLMVRPRDSHDLRLHGATLKVDPAPSAIHWAHDVFGNSVCLLQWPDELRTTTLRIVSTLDLMHFPDCPDLPAAALYPWAETYPFSYPELEAPDLALLATPQYPDPQGRVAAWARSFIGGEAVPTRELLSRITHAIKADFRYGARHEEGTQTAAETIDLGTGTCRDFALLMMEACRHLGLAAKFVTGYLYDDCGTTRGGGFTHAWCSVYLPGAGWVEYDPTNGLIAGSNLVRIGVTRGPEQAVPVSGGYYGRAGDTKSLDVNVTVTAVPRSAKAKAPRASASGGVKVRQQRAKPAPSPVTAA